MMMIYILQDIDNLYMKIRFHFILQITQKDSEIKTNKQRDLINNIRNILPTSYMNIFLTFMMKNKLYLILNHIHMDNLDLFIHGKNTHFKSIFHQIINVNFLIKCFVMNIKSIKKKKLKIYILCQMTNYNVYILHMIRY